MFDFNGQTYLSKAALVVLLIMFYTVYYILFYLHSNQKNFMKTIKTYILCITLFFTNNQYAHDSKTPDQNAIPQNSTSAPLDNDVKSLIAANIATPLLSLIAFYNNKCSLFGAIVGTYSVQQISYHQYYQNHKETDSFVAENYPYAQAWYNNLATQHPTAHLNEYKLLKSTVSAVDAMTGDNSLTASCVPYRINLPEENLEMINALYKKKAEGQELTFEEQINLGSAEWTLFHEAGHLKNHDLTQGTFVFAATAAIVEIGYQMSKHTIIKPTSWPLYLGLHMAIYASMIVSQDILYETYSRYRETRADAFANQYADDIALLGGKQLLQKNNEIVLDTTILSGYLFASHPTHTSRIQAIDKEIAHRQKLAK